MWLMQLIIFNPSVQKGRMNSEVDGAERTRNSQMGKIKNKWDSVPLTVRVSAAYAICSILQRCLSFITLPLFTRLLTTEQYGQYTVYQSWLSVLSIFLTLNLAYGSFSTAMVKFENDREGYVSAVEGICFVLSLAFLIIYLPFQTFWNMFFELPTFFVCLMVAELLGTNAIQLWSGKKRFEFKYKLVVGITLGMSILSPVLAYIFVINSTEKGYARMLGYSLISITVGGFFFIRNVMKGKKVFNREYWDYALSFNVPLIVYYLSQVIFNQSDRIMISHMVGTDKAAVYGVAYSFAMILTFVLNAINNSYLPWYYTKIKEGKQEENREVSIAVAVIMALLLSVVIWFSPEIILFFAGEKYAEAVYVIPPVAVSLLLLFYSQLFANVEFYYEEKKKLVGASIGAATVNLVFNWIFIRIFGFMAAAYTTLASYVLFAGANYFAMKQILKERSIEDNAYNYKGLLLVLAGFSVLSVIGVLLYGLLVVRIIVMLSVIAWVTVKRERLISFYKTVFRRI